MRTCVQVATPLAYLSDIKACLFSWFVQGFIIQNIDADVTILICMGGGILAGFYTLAFLYGGKIYLSNVQSKGTASVIGILRPKLQ